jgi:hypothetical protein
MSHRMGRLNLMSSAKEKPLFLVHVMLQGEILPRLASLWAELKF